jgi:hypothetical protein
VSGACRSACAWPKASDAPKPAICWYLIWSFTVTADAAAGPA